MENAAKLVAKLEQGGHKRNFLATVPPSRGANREIDASRPSALASAQFFPTRCMVPLSGGQRGNQTKFCASRSGRGQSYREHLVAPARQLTSQAPHREQGSACRNAARPHPPLKDAGPLSSERFTTHKITMPTLQRFLQTAVAAELPAIHVRDPQGARDPAFPNFLREK